MPDQGHPGNGPLLPLYVMANIKGSAKPSCQVQFILN